jgi:hypothetical protein
MVLLTGSDPTRAQHLMMMFDLKPSRPLPHMLAETWKVDADLAVLCAGLEVMRTSFC